MSSRKATVALALVGVIAVGGVGVLVGTRLRNPNSTIPPTPKPSRLVAPVLSKKLATTLVTRGTGTLVGFQPLTVTNASIGAVVTRTAPIEADLKEGDIAFTVDDVPVFILQGKIPTYRDLKPGDSGRDVEQLDNALKRLGKLAGAPNDRYDDSTEQGVERLFRDAGAIPVGPKKEELSALLAARKAVTDADTALFRSKQELATSNKPVSADQLIAAREAVDAAKDALDRLPEDETKARAESEAAVRSKQRAILEAEAAVRKADLDLEEAKRNSTDQTAIQAATRAASDAREKVRETEVAVTDAIQMVEDAKFEVQVATDAVPRAKDAVETLRKRAATLAAEAQRARAFGPVVLSNEPIPATEVEALIRQAEEAAREAAAAVTVGEQTLRTAERDVVIKTRAVTAAERNVEKAKQLVEETRRVVPIADEAIEKAKKELLTRTEQLPIESTRPEIARETLNAAKSDLEGASKALVNIEKTLSSKRRSTNAQFETAKAALNKLLSPPDVANLASQLKAASAARDTAADSLRELELKTGFVLPQGSIVFTPDPRVHVISVDSPVGVPVNAGSTIITVSTGALGVDAVIEAADRQAVTKGASAIVEFPEASVTLTGTVISVGTKPDKNDPAVYPFKIELQPGEIRTTSGDKLPSYAFAGLQARVSLVTQTMPAEGLVVPLSAIVTTANRKTVVLVQDDPKTALRAVPVKTGLTGDGEVEVTPLQSARLKVGDLVQVANAPEADASGADASGANASEADTPGSDGPNTSDASDSGAPESAASLIAR
jgi:multidrug efflux pump subunit AcrA (membrane-fusion protein)